MSISVYLAVFIVTFTLILIIPWLWRNDKKHGHGKKKCKPTSISILRGLYIYIKVRIQGLSVAEKLFNESDTGIFRLGFGFKSVYFVNNVDAIQKILKSNAPSHLHKPKIIYNLVFPPPLSDGLPASSLDIWTPHRKALSPVFAYKSLGIYLQYTNTCAQDMVDVIRSLETEGKNRKIHQENVSITVGYFLIKLMTQVIVGSETSSFSDLERKIFYDNFATAKEIAVARLLNPLLLLPPVWYFHPKRQQYEAITKSSQKFCYEVINRYRAKEKVGSPETMEKYLTAPAKPKVHQDNKVQNDVQQTGARPFNCLVEQMMNTGFSKEEVANEVATFLAAGHDALNKAFDSLIFQLALHPEYQKKCQEEVDHIFSGKKEASDLTSLTMDDLSNMKYLEQCIMEILRLTPTVPIFARLFEEPLDVSADWTIKRGDIVVMCPWVVHRDPEYYPNPTVFDPDRFLAENVKQRNLYSYVPFSVGARNCIGYKLGLVIMKILMAELIHNFEFSTTDKPDDVRIYFNVTIQPERHYDVIYTRRR